MYGEEVYLVYRGEAAYNVVAAVPPTFSGSWDFCTLKNSFRRRDYQNRNPREQKQYDHTVSQLQACSVARAIVENDNKSVNINENP